MAVIVLLLVARLKPAQVHILWNGARGRQCRWLRILWWLQLTLLRLLFVRSGRLSWRSHTLVTRMPVAMQELLSVNYGRQLMTWLR